MDMTEKTLRSETLFQGKILTLRRDVALLPNGNEATREVVTHPGGVAVCAIDASRNVLMVRQFRYPIGDLCFELPAGKLDAGEEPIACGKRELSEETGMTAQEYVYLGGFHPSPGFCNEVIHVFLARGLEQQAAHPDEDEFLEVESVPLDTLIDQVMNNEITDAKTVIGLLKANEYLRRESSR